VTLKQRVLAIQDVALCVIRKWWRPVTCIGIAGGSVVNLVAIPLSTGKPIDLAQAAAFVTACAAAFAVREVGKAWGTADK
jgi:hypothetical protein